MNGVEILSSEIIYNTILPEYWIGIGLLVGMLSITVFSGSAAADNGVLALISLAFIIGSVVVACLGGIDSKTDINHIEYKVTIDDSVSMNEFLDKYEILDKEGKIYTVKERE